MSVVFGAWAVFRVWWGIKFYESVKDFVWKVCMVVVQMVSGCVQCEYGIFWWYLNVFLSYGDVTHAWCCELGQLSAKPGIFQCSDVRLSDTVIKQWRKSIIECDKSVTLLPSDTKWHSLYNCTVTLSHSAIPPLITSERDTEATFKQQSHGEYTALIPNLSCTYWHQHQPRIHIP
jgi:hypothetical protein